MNINLQVIFLGWILTLIKITNAEKTISNELETFIKVNEGYCSSDDAGNNVVHVNTSTGGPCQMSVSNSTIGEFVKLIRKQNYKFIHIRLRFTGNGSVDSTSCVIQPQEWVWAFPGHLGVPSQYLRWPPEYRVWSMGLLSTDVLVKSFPIDIHIQDSKSCPIVIGHMNTTRRIAGAFTNMAVRLMMDHDKDDERYHKSYFCYKTTLRCTTGYLCHNVIYPFETTAYRCCYTNRHFGPENHVTTTYCSNEKIYYESVWKYFTFIIGLILFMYSPIPLLKKCGDINDWIYSHTCRHIQSEDANEETYLLQNYSIQNNENWLSTNPISITWIVLRPIRRVCEYSATCVSRISRITFVFLSFLVIAIELIVHGIYQKDFIVSSVKQGSPMNFLSMLAGNDLARDNFLPIFGGPFIATGMYIVGLILIMGIPRDLAHILEHGLPRPVSMTSPSFQSLFSLNISDRKRLEYNTETSTNGYLQIYSSMVANFFLLLNPSFAGHVLRVQILRLKCIASAFAIDDNCVMCTLYIILMPFYVAVCVAEILICIVYYGMPMVFYMFTFIRGYSRVVWSMVDTSCTCYKYVTRFCIIIIILAVLFVAFMFNIIFVASFLFLSRVAVFTYTGLFACVNDSSGYLVFSITILMYFIECLRSVKTVYKNIFKNVLVLCESHQMKHPHANVYQSTDDAPYIPKRLFMLIVNRFQPLRVQLFKTLLNISITVLVLYLSVDLLVNFEKFQELSTLTQVATTIFVCSIPQLVNRLCKQDKSRARQKWKKEVTQFISDYCAKLGENTSVM